jgi:hypothetical protein
MNIPHIVSQPLGWAAQGVGGALGAAGVDRTGARLNNIGQAITNPNMVLSQPQNILNAQTSGASAFTAVPHAVAQPRNVQSNTPNPGSTPQAPGGAYQGGGGGGSDGSVGSAEDLAYLDSQMGLLRGMLGQTDNTLNQGLTNLSDSSNRETSKANQQRSRALEDFGIQHDDTARNKQGALGKVDDNARTLNDSLRRILGMASGSSSSAYQLAAPNAVAREASKNRTGVLENFGENERNIGLAEDRAKVDFQDLLDDLERQRREKESQLRGGVLEQQQGINRNMADLAAEKSKLLGGGYGAARVAQQPFSDAISRSQSALDGLFSQFRSPMLAPKPVTVQKPELRDYVVDKASVNANNTQGQSQYSPYAQPLKKPEDENKLV